MLYWAQEDELKRQARRRNRRPAGSESEDSELSEEEFLDMEDIEYVDTTSVLRLLVLTH